MGKEDFNKSTTYHNQLLIRPSIYKTNPSPSWLQAHLFVISEKKFYQKPIPPPPGYKLLSGFSLFRDRNSIYYEVLKLDSKPVKYRKKQCSVQASISRALNLNKKHVVHNITALELSQYLEIHCVFILACLLLKGVYFYMYVTIWDKIS